MRGWLRLVLPTTRVFGAFVGSYLVVVGADVYLRTQFGPRFDPRLEPATVLLLVATTAYYGLFRAVYFHPLYRPDYRRWLEGTPWTLGKPLPVGPLHLTIQDVVVVGLQTLLMVPVYPRWAVAVPWVFAAVYLVATWAFLWPTGQWRFAYAIAFGGGLLLHLAGDPWKAMTVMGCLLLVAHFGVRRALMRFPWDVDRLRENLARYDVYPSQQRAERLLGWPHERLGPKRTFTSITYTHALLVSALVPWWLSAIDAVLPPNAQSNVVLVIAVAIICGAPVCRFLVYRRACAPPITLWGRLLTGRWFIPGYDKLYLAPLACFATGVALLGLLQSAGLDRPLTAFITAGWVLFAVLSVGPSLRRWELTAPARLGPRKDSQAHYLKL